MLQGFNDVLSSGSFKERSDFDSFSKSHGSICLMENKNCSNRTTHLAGPPVVHTKKRSLWGEEMLFFLPKAAN